MLRGRKTKLHFDDYVSEWFDITNGIGQGDPLSMILYIIYDSDLVEIAKGKQELTLRRCTNRTMIFTDGSSTNGKVGAAASLYINFTHIATLRYHLGNDSEHTVFEAKAVGLILAVQLLLTRSEASFPATIFIDNQAVIRSGA